MKIILLGNAGAGKSTMAKRLIGERDIPLLSLDKIAWYSGPARKPLSESVELLEQFLQQHDSWIIEGCYSGLVEYALQHCDELRFLNPGLETCLRHCHSRPWEPEKFDSPAEQQEMLKNLIAWVKDYETRKDEYGLKAHRQLFDRFTGRKREYTSVEQYTETKNASLEPIETIIRHINASSSKGKTKLVAIDGRGGSGKSSLAAALVSLSQTLKIVPVDAFPCTPDQHPWHPLGTQTWVNWERLRDEAILPLRSGNDATFMRTPWWKEQAPGPVERVAWGGTVIVEGCYALRRELRDLYDLRIWVECAVEEAMESAIRRDGENVRRSWAEAYVPNETSYIASHQPENAADIVVSSKAGQFGIIKTPKN